MMFDFYKQRREEAEELAIHKTGTILYRVVPIFYGTTLCGELEKYIVANIPCQVVGVSLEDGMIEHYIRSCDTMNFDNEAFTDVLIGSATAGEHNNHGNYYYFTDQIQAEAYCTKLNAKLNEERSV